MMTLPRRAAALITVAALLSLTACGSGSGDDASPSNTEAPVASETPLVSEAPPVSDAPDVPEPTPGEEIDDVVAEPTPTQPVETDGGDMAEPDADSGTSADTDTESEADKEPAEPAGLRTIEHAYGTTEMPAAPERIVALSEEFLLADLLALGVTPVASSSNDASGFGTIDPALTDGIEILTSASFNIERLAALRPDLIVAYPVYIELVGYDTLNAVAPTVAIGDDGSDWRELVRLTAEVLGVDELGVDLIAEYEEAHEAARARLEGVRMSAASIFDPSFIRAYTDGGTFLVDVMLDAGVVLVPDASSVDGVDGVGRIQLSLEQLELLQGDVLLLLQRLGVEDDGAAAVTETALWSTLPAVQADAVITLDRLAYPGAAGAAAFITALADEVSALQ